jgi:hypothetical protein
MYLLNQLLSKGFGYGKLKKIGLFHVIYSVEFIDDRKIESL